ncbi:MAG: NYN domain-containing protein [Fibrobacter sp.]|nr:NYN domain-containing protein [Fibrobacter sp.]
MLKKSKDFGKSDTFKWVNDFHNELKKKRKVALRMGRLAGDTAHFALSEKVTKQIFNGKKRIEDIAEDDFALNIRQKGVDMKIGIDISSLAYKRLVEQVVLIAGDSDFVPVAKLARREGIDFILDPMWAPINPELFEHIDGLRSVRKPKE